MPSSKLGQYDLDEADEGIARVQGKAIPTRTRARAKAMKLSKARTSKPKRKPTVPAGMHQRRNKRMSW